MPLPIRPVKETEDGALAKTYSDPFAFVPMSALQKQIMEQEAAPYNEPVRYKEARSYKSIDKVSRRKLFEIWSNRETEIVQAQTSLNMEPSFKVPSNISSSEVMKLVAQGLLSRKDNNRVSFTGLGKQALNKEVMEQPNSFMTNRTREKALKIAQTSETTNTTSPDATNTNTDTTQTLDTSGQTDEKFRGCQHPSWQ